uniref:Uncharacterized protein n=1 Tax=Graphocephala atropunctata TaxID=36148 RepID=A0A1B6LXR9_9HEMI
MKLCSLFLMYLLGCVHKNNGEEPVHTTAGHKLVKRQSIAEMYLEASCTLVCKSAEANNNMKFHITAPSDYGDDCFYECELIPIVHKPMTNRPTQATGMMMQTTQANVMSGQPTQATTTAKHNNRTTEITKTPEQPSHTTHPEETTVPRKITIETTEKKEKISTTLPSEIPTKAESSSASSKKSLVTTQATPTKMEPKATSAMTTARTTTTARSTTTSMFTTTKPLLYYYTNDLKTTPDYDY